MVLMAIGLLLLALGLFSGAVLLLAPFGLVGMEGYTLWAMFPLLCLVGFAMCGMQGRTAQVRLVTQVASVILLLLAAGSVAALVLGSASLVRAPASTGSLWFVMGVGAVLGSIGAAAFGRANPEP